MPIVMVISTSSPNVGIGIELPWISMEKLEPCIGADLLGIKVESGFSTAEIIASFQAKLT